jgi:hypothetical protein
VTSDPRAFFTLDLGVATTAAALIGLIDGRWRLLGALAFPSSVERGAVLTLLADRILAADRAVGSAIDATGLGPPTEWPRLACHGIRPGRIAVLAATESSRERLAATAEAAGWLVTSGSLERDDALGLLRSGLEMDRPTILAGASDPPSGAERGRTGSLGALIEAIGERRPEATIVLAGGLAASMTLAQGGAADALSAEGRVSAIDDAPGGASEQTVGQAHGDLTDTGGPAACAEVLYAPGPSSTHGTATSDDPLRRFLERLRETPGDGAPAIARATASLAAILDRRVETVSIGLDAGMRVFAWPPRPNDADDPAEPVDLPEANFRAAVVPDAGLVPAELDDRFVDQVLSWSTVPFDRIRLRDRLTELRRAPWGDPDGDGAALRLAAARAALARLVEATPGFTELGSPDLIVATGGAFVAAPGPAVALALADTLRRPGASGLAIDHARLLGPLGTIPDEGERRQLLGDLVDDLLAPLGSIVSPAGIRAGHGAGRVTVHAGTGSTEFDLVAGGLQLVDLPPGQVATAEFEFRDTVRLGVRGRHFSVEVAGGLGGLLVDLRDVPLRLPDRIEHRRELLATWQAALWAGADR